MVAEDFPWPSLGGGLIRLAKMVETVSAMGELDFFSLYDPDRNAHRCSLRLWTCRGWKSPGIPTR